MSVVYTIVLDREDPGLETVVPGEAIARASDELATLCVQLGLPALDNFVAMSSEEISDLLDEDIEFPQHQIWFAPDEGLRVIAELTRHLKASPADVADAPSVLAELADCADLLVQAKALGARWHLNLDV